MILLIVEKQPLLEAQKSVHVELVEVLLPKELQTIHKLEVEKQIIGTIFLYQKDQKRMILLEVRL